MLVEDPEKGEPVTSCMDFYESKIRSDESIDKLKLRIVVRGGLQNKDSIGDTWSTTAYMSTLKQLLSDAVKNNAIVNQLYFIGVFL